VNVGSRAPASLSFIWRCARGGPTATKRQVPPIRARLGSGNRSGDPSGEITSLTHNTTSIFPPAVNGDLSIPTTKSIDTPSFDSFLVLEVCLFNFLLLVLS
jgi:hypothetical protein